MNAGSTRLTDSFIPDAALIFRDNVPADWDIDTPHPGAPDFAVAIVSAHDRAEYHKHKLTSYLANGTVEVWRVNPRSRMVERCWLDANGAETTMTVQEGRIDTSRFLPDWTITVEEVFRLPEWIRRQSGRT